MYMYVRCSEKPKENKRRESGQIKRESSRTPWKRQRADTSTPEAGGAEVGEWEGLLPGAGQGVALPVSLLNGERDLPSTQWTNKFPRTLTKNKSESCA